MGSSNDNGTYLNSAIDVQQGVASIRLLMAVWWVTIAAHEEMSRSTKIRNIVRSTSLPLLIITKLTMKAF